MTKAQLALAFGAGALGALAVLALANPRFASAEAPPKPTLWEQRCVDGASVGKLIDGTGVKLAGLSGWELAAVSVYGDGINREEGAVVCYKRPIVGTPPISLVGPGPDTAPMVTTPPPTERDLVAAIGNHRALLTACRNTYARQVAEVPLEVTVAPSGARHRRQARRLR
ncbi:MAG TPA: hypothetical protein VGL86_09990 [Polyangia bacterium]|jgi:hypothetical protein